MRQGSKYRLFASACVAAALLGGAARAATLADAIAYAYQNNPGLRSQRAALKGVDENYVQARGAFGPAVSVNASNTGYQEVLTGPQGGKAYAQTQSESLQISQPLYAGGKLNSQLSQAEAQILSARETLRRLEMDLLTQVVDAYTSVRRDEALLRVNQDTVTVLERQESDTESRFKVRTVTMTDVAEAKSRLASARAGLANAQAALGQSRAQYIAVVGQTPATLEPPPPLTGVPKDISQAFDSAERNSPLLLGAQYSEQRSRARVAEAKAARLPTVSAQLAWTHTPYLPYGSNPYQSATSATVSVSQPLFTSGQLSSQIRAAQDQNNSDRLQIDETRNQVILGVTTAWEQLSALRNQLKTLEDAVAASSFAFYGNREEEKLDLRSTIDVLNAQLELTGAQQNVIRARAQEYLGQARILAAMGVLNVAQLSPGVTTYDAAANFREVQHKGETPLEWPARTLDAIGGMRVGAPPPASVAEVRPNASAMPAAPGPEKPIPSILNAIDTPPPEPR